MTKTGDLERGTLILVEDRNIKEHFCYEKEYWLLGEYEYTENGVFFTNENDAEIYKTVKEIKSNAGGRMFIDRLNSIFVKLEELIGA